MRGRGPVTDPVPLSTVSVTVLVLDVNDNAPQFHEVSPRLIHIGNSIAAGSSVAQMLATDADSGRRGSVIYQLSPGSSSCSYYRIELDLKLLTMSNCSIMYCDVICNEKYNYVKTVNINCKCAQWSIKAECVY